MPDKFCSQLDSPFGSLFIQSTSIGVSSISLQTQDNQDFTESHHSFQCRKELIDYFDGRLKKFTVNLDLSGNTAFHIQVWKELLKIPYGKTVSYTDLANNLNKPKAIRAVGRANGLNPLPFIIPCHRVIGANGSLTGYALGLKVKRSLLALENPKVYPLQQSLF